MLRAEMFGMGMGEILVILVIALLFLGPEKLPDAAKAISRTIRDLRKQTRELQNTLEGDNELGSAIREIKGALRGDDLRTRPNPPPPTTAGVAGVAAANASGDLSALQAKSAPAAELAAGANPTSPETLDRAEANDIVDAPEKKDSNEAVKEFFKQVDGGADDDGPNGTDDTAPELPRVRPAAGAVAKGSLLSPAEDPATEDVPGHG